MRELAPKWGGGRKLQHGYVAIKIPELDPYMCIADKNGYILEHRYVMSKYLGRPMDPKDTVHHIDGDKKNNALSNLQHRIGRHGKGVVVICGDCGSNDIEFLSLDDVGHD